MRYGLIYIIKNKINEKVYIGQTMTDVETRWQGHLKKYRQGFNYKIYNAMRKYGVENFYYEVLEENIPENLLDQKEINYIEKYNSFKGGYNLTRGGDGRIFLEVDENNIVKEYENGKSTSLIATEYGVSSITILRILKRKSIKIRDANKLSDKELNSFKVDYKNGMKLKDLAIKYSIDMKTVGRIRNKLNLPKRQKKVIKNKAHLEKSKLIKDYESNLTLDEIANKYNTTVKTIRKKIKSLNLPPRKNLNRKEINEVEFKNDYLNGEAWDFICKKYNISESTGMKIRNRLNLPKRKDEKV